MINIKSRQSFVERLALAPHKVSMCLKVDFFKGKVIRAFIGQCAYGLIILLFVLDSKVLAAGDQTTAELPSILNLLLDSEPEFECTKDDVVGEWTLAYDGKMPQKTFFPDNTFGPESPEYYSEWELTNGKYISSFEVSGLNEPLFEWVYATLDESCRFMAGSWQYCVQIALSTSCSDEIGWSATKNN